MDYGRVTAQHRFLHKLSISMKWFAAGTAVLGTLCLVVGLWIPAKAVAAQVLIERTWERARLEDRTVKPWPWIDTWPVARLSVPKHEISLVALQGVSGQALAFGPGLQFIDGSDGDSKAIMIAGHNDTHFSFLQDLELGDAVFVETGSGPGQYTVMSAVVFDTRDGPLRISDSEQLVLVTCYPFNVTASNGPLRYVVTALPNRKGGM